AEAARQEEARRLESEAREREVQAREKEEALAELRELERMELARAEVEGGTRIGEDRADSFHAGLGDAAVADQPPLPPEPRFKGMGLAQRMLEKMGWREGQGLGSRGQGIAAPLAMQKTDARAGIIVAQEAAPLAPLPPGATRVLLLCNMVGPGQVDESLEDEAYAALNGRFFGGRTVHAEFFSEERFERSELAPTA
ncbi:hypothetical protein H632_c2503p0, partial [Helicosporidium sp. ATCC 50920]